MKASYALASIVLGTFLAVPAMAYASDATDLPVFDFSFADEGAINVLAPTQIEVLAEVSPPGDGDVIVAEEDDWQLIGLRSQLAAIEGTIADEADVAQAALAGVGQDASAPTATSDGASQTSSTTVTAFVYTSDPAARGSYSCLLDVDGTPVSYVDVSRTNVVPDTGAGLWRGSDSTTDGSWGYFVGHNPGSFACVMGLAEGDPVTVWDESGNSRTYRVATTFDVPTTTMWEELQPQIAKYGESVVMQTCNGDSLYRIVVAR